MPADRISAPLSLSPLVQLTGNTKHYAKPEYDKGRLPSSAALESITLTFLPSAAQQQDLDYLLAAQHNPASPLYHQWITPAEYAARFGVSANDLQKISNWLTSQGFSIVSQSPAGNSITVRGTVNVVETAFQTEIHQYLVNGQLHFANATNPSLPQQLAAMVAGIQGLDNFFPQPKFIPAVQSSTSPLFTSSESGSHFLSPSDFATIYNTTPFYSAGLHGESQTIAIVGQTSIYTNDIIAFRSAASLPSLTYTSSLSSTSTPYLSTYCVSSVTSNCTKVSTSDLPESDLDIELSGGVAYNANLLFVYDPQSSVFNAYEYAINNNLAPIISISYGECEDYVQSLGNVENKSEATTLQVYTKEGNSQGQTTIVASGDSGAAACDTSSTTTSAVDGLQVDIPADIPEVTAAGGTEFYPDAAASCTSGSCNGSTPSVYAGTSWWQGTPSSTDVLSSATGYIPEVVWNDNAVYVPQKAGFAGGGGGISQAFAKPSWQTTLTTPADTASGTVTTQRDVPDIAMNASAYHDAYLVCTQLFNSSNVAQGTSCTNGFRNGSNGGLTAYGGTSTVAPSFAGILALMEQRNHTTYGNLNTELYSLAGNSTTYASAFHDVQPQSSGVLFGANNNNDPCTIGKQNCTTGTMGYSTLVGYDLATGLGSVNGYNLAVAANPLTPTSVALSYLPDPVTTLSGTVTLTATVQPAPPSSSVTPTGSVSFTVNGSALSGNPYSLSGGSGIATASATVNFPGSGVQTVSASYTGDTNFIGSNSSTSLTVSKVTPTVTVTPTSYSITTLQSLQVTVSVSGTPTATGTITLTAGTYNSGAVNLTNGSATFTIPAGSMPANLNTIVGIYSGDNNYASTTGSSSFVTVSKVTPTVSVTPTTYSISTIQSLQVTVAVSGTPTATGTVTLSSGTYSSGAITLTSGSAIITIPAGSLASGNNTLSASYSGDSNYATATGTSNTVTVSKVTPTVSVTPTTYSISTIQSLQVTVAVSGTPSPTGTVTLTSGTYSSGAINLTSGSAIITIPAGSLASGSDTLSASYSGDSNYATATGSSATVSVGKLTTTVSVAASATTMLNLQPLNVTVTLTGQPSPTGTVTLTSGTYSSGAVGLTSGSVIIAVPANSLAVGTDTLTATYSGDAIYAGNVGTTSVSVVPVIASATTPAQVVPGASTTATITFASGSTYSGTMALTCSLTSSPTGAQTLPTCSLNPTSITLAASGTATSTFTVYTSAATTSSLAQPSWRGLGGSGAALAGLLLLVLPRRRRAMGLLLCLLAIVITSATGCGGSKSSAANNINTIPATSAGSYTFTVTGTDTVHTSTTAATTVTVTVQ